MSCKAARRVRNSKNEARDHVVSLVDLCDLVDRERKDKVTEIAESWCEWGRKRERMSNTLVTGKFVESHILAGRCPVDEREQLLVN